MVTRNPVQCVYERQQLCPVQEPTAQLIIAGHLLSCTFSLDMGLGQECPLGQDTSGLLFCVRLLSWNLPYFCHNLLLHSIYSHVFSILSNQTYDLSSYVFSVWVLTSVLFWLICWFCYIILGHVPVHVDVPSLVCTLFSLCSLTSPVPETLSLWRQHLKLKYTSGTTIKNSFKTKDSRTCLLHGSTGFLNLTITLYENI